MVMVFAVLCMALLNSPTVYAQSSKVLIMGDSLSAEYGLPRGTGWVKLLENRLKKKYPDIQDQCEYQWRNHTWWPNAPGFIIKNLPTQSGGD